MKTKEEAKIKKKSTFSETPTGYNYQMYSSALLQGVEIPV